MQRWQYRTVRELVSSQRVSGSVRERLEQSFRTCCKGDDAEPDIAPMDLCPPQISYAVVAPKVMRACRRQGNSQAFWYPQLPPEREWECGVGETAFGHWLPHLWLRKESAYSSVAPWCPHRGNLIFGKLISKIQFFGEIFRAQSRKSP